MQAIHRITAVFSVAILSTWFYGCSDDPGRSSGRAVPVIALSTDSVEFEALAGGANPPSKNVTVTNSGVGDLTFSAFTSANWIDVVYSEGQDPGTIIISVSTAMVEAGTITDSVTVTSPEAGNSPQYIHVKFTVSRIISSSRGTLIFSALSGWQNPEPQYFQVINRGGGFMSYSITKSAPWLSLTNSSGVAPDSVGVVIDITTLTAGIYTDTLTIISPETTNDSAHVVVILAASSWTLSNQGIDHVHNLQGLTFSPDNTGWAVGFVGAGLSSVGAVYRTTDSGQTWTQILTRDKTSFGDIAFVNEMIGCVVGENGVIMRTEDGGDSWTDVENLPVDSTRSLWSLEFSSPSRGFAVGTLGTILRTEDIGATWQQMNSQTTLSLAAISFVDEFHGWVAGNNGKILHTSDGGTIWETQPSQTNRDLWGIYFVDLNTGWVVGSSGDVGIVLTTDNGGATWEVADVGSSVPFQDIFFIDPLHAWIVGLNGTILHTMDGGETWLPQYTKTEEWLFEVHFLDVNNGLVVGNNGIVLRTGRGGF